MLVFPFTITTESDTQDTNDRMVYICTGKSSKRYHATPKCKGLDNCRGEIVKVTVQKAKSMGRTPCRLCD